MSSSIGVMSVTNLKNGSTVKVTLSGSPTGNLEIWGCEVADAPEFGCPYTILSATEFEVILPAFGIWYLWAKDANGFGDQSGAVYMGVSDDDDTDALGSWVADTLNANKAGMEALIQTWYPKTTIKHIHYGVVASLINFPSIAITDPHSNSSWAAMPFFREWHYQYTIACDAQKSEEENDAPLATKMMEAVMEILNLRRYNSPIINGRGFWDCGAMEGNATEVKIDDVGWVAIASVVYTGKLTKQIKAPSFGPSSL